MMMDMLISTLTIAGVASMVALPMAVVSLLGAVRKVGHLEARNGAQAVTIAGLERSILSAGGVPTISVGADGEAVRGVKWEPAAREVPAPPRGLWPLMRFTAQQPAVCDHGIRWPHPCTECDAAPPPPGYDPRATSARPAPHMDGLDETGCARN